MSEIIKNYFSLLVLSYLYGHWLYVNTIKAFLISLLLNIMPVDIEKISVMMGLDTCFWIRKTKTYSFLIGINLRWGFLIWELIFFIYCRLFVLILVDFFVLFSSFTTFQLKFTPGLQVILPRPRIGMLSLVTVSPVITTFHSCCLSHRVFDQVNLWPASVGFETVIFWQCSPGTVETQRLYPMHHGPRGRSRMDFLVWR